MPPNRSENRRSKSQERGFGSNGADSGGLYELKEDGLQKHGDTSRMIRIVSGRKSRCRYGAWGIRRSTARGLPIRRSRRLFLSYNVCVPVALSRLTDNQLLDLRLCDLPVRIKGTRLEQRIGRLYRELDARRLRFHPHVWLSEEWFTPDATPGFAIPFYLADPRLIRLERAQMLEVEGAGEWECMKILRHEAGHAIDNAYGLHSQRAWTTIFGPYRKAYPKFYQPQPDSREYVLNLDAWYAQAHPAEDFAETFAVWLKPAAPWRKQYQDWGALRKLDYVNDAMRALENRYPTNSLKAEVDPLRQLTTTLREHYRRKRIYYTMQWPPSFERSLYRVFSADPRHRRLPSAAQFLRLARKEIGPVVAQGTGVHPYTVNHLLRQMIVRCRQLKLRLALPEEQAKYLSIVTLTMQIDSVLREGYHRIPL